jgi:hypothetical protein
VSGYERALSLAAFKFELVSIAAITENDYERLMNVTQEAFDDLYRAFFSKLDDVSYVTTNVHQYGVLAPSLVRFEVSVQFDANSTSIPSVEQVEVIASEGFADGGEANARYLQLLNDMEFSPFATTTSVRYIEDSVVLQDVKITSVDENIQGGSQPLKVVLPIASMAVLFIVITAACIRKQNQIHGITRNEEHDMNGTMNNKTCDVEVGSVESTHVSEYRTSVFSDDGIERENERELEGPTSRQDTGDEAPYEVQDLQNISLSASSESGSFSDDDTTNISQLTGNSEVVSNLNEIQKLQTDSNKRTGEYRRKDNRSDKLHWTSTLSPRNRFSAPETIEEDDEASNVSSKASRIGESAFLLQVPKPFQTSVSYPTNPDEEISSNEHKVEEPLCDLPVKAKVPVSVSFRSSIIAPENKIPAQKWNIGSSVTSSTGTKKVDDNESKDSVDGKPAWISKKLRPVPEEKPESASVASLAKKFQKPPPEVKKIEKAKNVLQKKVDSSSGKPEWMSKPLRPTGIILGTEANQQSKTKMNTNSFVVEAKAEAQMTDISYGQGCTDKVSDQNFPPSDDMTEVIHERDTHKIVEISTIGEGEKIQATVDCESTQPDYVKVSSSVDAHIQIIPSKEKGHNATETGNRNCSSLNSKNVVVLGNLERPAPSKLDTRSRDNLTSQEKIEEKNEMSKTEPQSDLDSSFPKGNKSYPVDSSVSVESTKLIENEVTSSESVPALDIEPGKFPLAEMKIETTRQDDLISQHDSIVEVSSRQNLLHTTSEVGDSIPELNSSKKQAQAGQEALQSGENYDALVIETILSDAETNQTTDDAKQLQGVTKIPTIEGNEFIHQNNDVVPCQSFAFDDSQSRSPQRPTSNESIESSPKISSQRSNKAPPSWMSKIPPTISSHLPKKVVEVSPEEKKPAWLKKCGSGVSSNKTSASSVSSRDGSMTSEEASTSSTPEWMKKFNQMGLQKDKDVA